jgi:hypothetical protein
LPARQGAVVLPEGSSELDRDAGQRCRRAPNSALRLLSNGWASGARRRLCRASIRTAAAAS